MWIKRINNKLIARLMTVLYIVSMLPVIIVALYDRATADDYGFSDITRNIWIEKHSLILVLKAACEKVYETYYTWQGTWFDVFVFSLQPEVFSDRAYWIGIVLIIILMSCSAYYFSEKVLVKMIGIERNISVFLVGVFLFLFYQFVPDKWSSIYWFNGVAHYILPTSIALWGVGNAAEYLISHKTRNIIAVMISFTLMGGANYLTAIWLMMMLFLIIAWYIVHSCNNQSFQVSVRKIWILVIPCVLEIVGLLISGLAPGNGKRENFSITIGSIFAAVLKAFSYSFKNLISYVINYPEIDLFILSFGMIIFWMMIKTDHLTYRKFKYPVIVSVYLYLIYVLVHWPEIFVDTGVSMGVPNTYFMTFYFMIFGNIIYWGGYLTSRYKERIKENHINILGIACILMLVISGAFFLLSGRFRTITDYSCYHFVSSGRASEFKEEMKLQTYLLERPNDMSPTIPIVNNNDIEPLFNMNVTSDDDAWINRALARFYGKKVVHGVTKEEWFELYK